MAEKQWQLLNSSEVEKKWPLHYYIFENREREFKEALLQNKVGIEEKDPCGRTALHLAVSLGRSVFVKELLQHRADANAVNKQGWNVCQEAVSCGIPDILTLIFKYRDCQRATQRLDGIPELLDDLKAAPDFYIEMKWEFTTWVPFMSRMCPNDTYRIYKKGCNVRVDTTLVGFDQSRVNWQRGNISFIFKGTEQGAEFMEVDHDRKTFTKELLHVRTDIRDVSKFDLGEEAMIMRMSSPNISTVLDTDSIAFTKHKSLWGWGGDKTDMVEKYEGKMYDATGIDVVTRIRFEHLTEKDKENAKASGTSSSGLQSMLSCEEQETECFTEDPEIVDPDSLNPYNLSVEEYFNIPLNKSKKDIGRPKDTVIKTQKFKATLCLCQIYPLSLQQQVLPVIKLLAISNSHFAKLRDFVALHLPAGFPIKIEIPVFHFLNARITFGNINAVITEVTGVQSQEVTTPTPEDVDYNDEETGSEARIACSIEDELFEVPAGYTDQSLAQQQNPVSHGQNEEELLIQLAIQQSLAESNAGEGPKLQGHSWDNQFLRQDEDDLQRAIRESLISSGQDVQDRPRDNTTRDNTTLLDVNSYEEQLQLALAMSQQDQSEQSGEQLQRHEDDELERILKLSLVEK